MIDTPLTKAIEDDELVIRIGLATLAYALQQGNNWPHDWEVTDIQVFGEEILREIDYHDMAENLFDEAGEKALDSGAMGVEQGKAENSINEISKLYF